MAKAKTGSSSSVLFPRDSIYELQKSVQGVELLAFLPPPEGVSEKRLSKFVETAFHPLRPWIAGVEPKGNGTVWNYETKEIVHEFSLEISLDAADADDTAAPAPQAALKTGGLLAKSSSPTATTYMRSNKSKGGALRMLFYDHEAIASVTQNAGDRVCFDESIIVLTATHVVMCDMNQTSAIRSVAPDDLHRQAPCSIEILPAGLLAIGCQDGKVRIWSPQLWRIVDIIDTGSPRDVQQLLFLPSQSPNACRSGSGSSATSSSVQASYATQHLVATTLDGKVVTWRVSVVDGASFECKKVSEVELKEASKQFDASSGINELKLHAHQEMMSAATKDGPVFFFDLAMLFRQAKGPNLLGILPSNKLPGALVVPGPRKASFVVLSIALSGSAVTISELVNKGRLVGKDNVPSSFHEFAVSAASESKDFKLFTTQYAALSKKFKVLSLTSSRHDATALCCLTTFGLLIVKTCGIPEITPAFITRGANKVPLLAFPSSAKVMLKFYGEETSAKQEDHKLQSGGDAPNEKLKTPLLHPCPSNSLYLAAVLPASAHVEILQMDSELRNQKSITMSSIFSGNAIAIAWHPTSSRFAALVPQDPQSRRMTRTQTSAHITPRRRGFMFGGSSKNIGDDVDGKDAKMRNQMARMMALTVFEISKDTGHVEMVEENCAGADDRLLHIFSGPLLGIVKFETSDDGGSANDGGSSKSLTDVQHSDSPSSMMRSKRTESSVFAAITPTFASSGSGSFSETPSMVEADTSDVKRTYLEFYEWDSVQKSGHSKPRLGGTLKKIGGAIECPLALEWERSTNRFCALIYPASVKIYRVTATPPDVVCLHEIPTFQPAQSLKWVNHTLFFSTEDEVKCCVVSKTRCFTFDLASALVADESLVRAARDSSPQFPQPQRLPAGATSILGVHNQQLLLARPVQALHSIDLSNKVVQCCILISRGKEEHALQIAETLSPELSDWLGSVFEAFGCVNQALKLSRVSTALKINMCIKHNMLGELENMLLTTPQSDSQDLTGASLFQRGCVCLHRAKQSLESLQKLFATVLTSKRFNDATFIAILLGDQDLLVQAYSVREDWRSAHNTAKQSSSGAQAVACIDKWNTDIGAPTSSWKVTLEAQHIRPPEAITLAASSLRT